MSLRGRAFFEIGLRSWRWGGEADCGETGGDRSKPVRLVETGQDRQTAWSRMVETGQTGRERWKFKHNCTVPTSFDPHNH